MTEWFNNLNDLQQIYTLVAIPSTLILVLQTLLLIFGIGFGHGDVDFDGHVDFDGGVDLDGQMDFDGHTDPGNFEAASHHGVDDSGLSLFSMRTIIAFLCIGGWSGMAMAETGMNRALVVLCSIACGFAALFLMAMLIRAMLSLQETGNIEISNAIGKVGQVYIPIPAGTRGKGKITLVLQGKFSELEAITDEEETIKTGEAVRVVSTDEAGLLLVQRIKRN